LLAREMREGRRAGRRGGEAKAAVIARQIQKEQLRSGKAVRAGATQGVSEEISSRVAECTRLILVRMGLEET
jgi:hypothetical protein